ncbi:MAG: hypothetical protein FJY98_02960 [Candidatus Liptonbacteria bacterium]|nr:hypothetical protein [Candidatus Liptonbacteria bacterium]
MIITMGGTAKTIAVIVGIVVLVLVVGIAAGWMGGAATTAKPYAGLTPVSGTVETSTPTSTAPTSTSGAAGTALDGSTSAGIGVGATLTLPQAVITYTDQGFSPVSLTISKGEKVIFENQSSRAFWPASAPHPAHTTYPERQGCVASTFDACGPQASGDPWEFQFNRVGTWRYHDHLNPSKMGTIIVQ